MTSHSRSTGFRRRISTWLVLLLAMGWACWVRVPIVVNAADHLDSDLAVDGITLKDAESGEWRWHYPGTPFIGIPGVLLSWVQARVFGVSPETLVSGGVLAWLLILGSTYWLNHSAFGSAAAVWGLVPLTFASAGALWLSARITGGHLLTVVWHATALLLWKFALEDRRWRRSLVLGCWCGLGLYQDRMFGLTLASILPISLLGWLFGSRSRAGVVKSIVFAMGVAIGFVPSLLGQFFDPHDAYQGQFQPSFEVDGVIRRADLLYKVCLPRLMGGHAYPSFGPEPQAASIAGRIATWIPGRSGSREFDILAASTTFLSVGLFALSLLALGRSALSGPKPSRMVALASMGSAALNIAAFLANRTVDQSDHYRYLVTLLVPWSSGFGLLAASVARCSQTGRSLAFAMACLLATMMSVDTYRWYRTYGWIDRWGLPLRVNAPDPGLAWIASHPEVVRLYGDYWDVYRLSFLARREMKPTPIAIYPDRFPEHRRSATAEEMYYRVVRRGPVPEGWELVGGGLGGRVVRWGARPGTRRSLPWEAR